MELHFEVKAVGKGAKGRTACGSAAYRACDKIIDNAGNVHNYRHKGGYVSGGVELPEGAPKDLRDRQVLWSRHEKKDIRKDAELFREIIVALPNELEREASERVMRGICAETTKLGMCAQWDLHTGVSYEDPDGNKVSKRHRKKGVEYVEVKNNHGHIMLTMRELLPDGSFGKKNRAWNHYNGGLNMAELLRPLAAQLMNDELAKINADKHVEHESYEARGVDKIPKKHIGVAAMAMERRGVGTVNGKRNRYIDWLNEIHAQNLREAEQNTTRLDKLIANANVIKDGTELFRDWDALFAMLRDIRRARAAFATERGKLEKIISAYAEKNEENTEYLKWAGFDPENEAMRMATRTTCEEINVNVKSLDIAEEIILDSKELMKAHNRVIYASQKVMWDQYQIDRKKRSFTYFKKRLASLGDYITHIRRSVSLLDVIFNTQEYQEYRQKIQSLEETRAQIHADYQKAKSEIAQHKTDLKEHKKEAADAARAKKKIEDEAR